jgi:hypothetical protein
MAEYIVLVTVNAMAAGRFVALVQGERVTLTDNEADDLLRAGYVEVAATQINVAAQVETAALAPTEMATAPAQRASRRKA